MKKLILNLLALSLSVGSLHAEAKYTDAFELATVEREIVKSVLDWKVREASQVLSVESDPSGINNGKALMMGPGLVYASFSPIGLFQENETIKITFQFRCTSQPADAFNAFRVGLYNDTSGTPVDGHAKGYLFATNPGSTQANGMLFYERGEDVSLSGGNDCTLLGKWFASDDYRDKPHKIILLIRRLAGDSGVEVSYQLDDNPSSLRISNTDAITTFNCLTFNMTDRSPSNRVLIDNIVISSETVAN